MNKLRCLICDRNVTLSRSGFHKLTKHSIFKQYGMMWPLSLSQDRNRDLKTIPTYSSDNLARLLGVAKVYVRDEGHNLSGSMKDYPVEEAVFQGVTLGYSGFTVVSCGNHAFSLANYAYRNNRRSIVFTPASSSKIPLLQKMSSVLVVAMEDAIFEDVYRECYGFADLPGSKIYNVNVNNEALLPGFAVIAADIEKNLHPAPSCITAGVGNGSYLAGIIWGFERLGFSVPRLLPVGMLGAFPSETAFNKGTSIEEHESFGADEQDIDAAEGSIAKASYSMPQLMHALKLSGGFPLGGLTNQDLAYAYYVLYRDEQLMDVCAIPEPTGIMGLAALLKHRQLLNPSDIPLISFTGAGYKDTDGIRRLVPDIANDLILKALIEKTNDSLLGEYQRKDNLILFSKNDSLAAIFAKANRWAEDV